MTSLTLPTLPTLGLSEPPKDVVPLDVATNWLAAFTSAVANKDTTAIAALFIPDGFWRDLLALTWNFRTFHGRDSIKKFAGDRLAVSGFSPGSLVLDKHAEPSIPPLFPDMTLLLFSFSFETTHGKGAAVAHLVPVAESNNIVWKAYTLFTNLSELKQFPEKTGPLRESSNTYEGWSKRPQGPESFDQNSPTVLIVGGGQTGLEIAARLKSLGVPTLVVEKHPHIGDSWRRRYRSLTLHDTVWYNHMPYLNFPTTFPTYIPASKLADWLESYASALDLSVWTSTAVQSVDWDAPSKTYSVKVKRDSEVRDLQVKHVVFATGFVGKPRIPSFPKRETFQGEVAHSSAWKSPEGYANKKAIVVGAGNSGLDIAEDMCMNGLDVTVVQRSSTYVLSVAATAVMLGARYNEDTPLDYADLASAALPMPVIQLLNQRIVPFFATTIDKDNNQGLNDAGFKTNLGIGSTGLIPLVYEKAGGYYIDTGAGKSIAEGRIKVKNGVAVESFYEKGLKLSDGTSLEADVVILATGYGDVRDHAYDVVSPEISRSLGKVWGVDKEGEVNSVWRFSGQENMWFGIGNLMMGRVWSKHLALQIKAIEEKILTRDDVYND